MNKSMARYKAKIEEKVLEYLNNTRLNQNILLLLIIITGLLLVICAGRHISATPFIFLILLFFISYGLSCSKNNEVQEIANFLTSLFVVCYLLAAFFALIFFLIISH